MTKIGQALQIEDTAVPQLCLSGMPIVGPALESPFFEPYEVPAPTSIRVLLSSAAKRRSQTLRRVCFMAEKSSDKLAWAIWEKTDKEVKKGTMGPPMTLDQLSNKYGPFFNVVPSFGLEQGVDDQGHPKYRRIDDHSAALNNSAAGRKQKIQMAGVDYLAVLVKALAEVSAGSLMLATEDLKGAYRQVPLLDSQILLAITAVYTHTLGQLPYMKCLGSRLGLLTPCQIFYRIAEWMCRFLVRCFSLLLDHFFDDFFWITRTEESSFAAFCVQEGFRLLGWELDPEKSQVPAEVASVLGVLFNLRSLREQKFLLVQAKPGRITNFCNLIDAVLDKGTLPPSLAASLVGKFGFLCSTLFGKAGRCCTGALRVRQYSTSEDVSLNPVLITSLHLMKLFVTETPPRKVSFGHSRKPVLLYTDASDVPEREPRFVLGAVLYDLDSPLFQYTFLAVPDVVVANWLPRANYMGQLEVMAGPVAVSTWHNKLRGRQVIHFVDNDSAAAGLVRGYSPKADSSPLIGHYWLHAACSQVSMYIERVESKSNLADGPSRLDFQQLQSWGAHYTQPAVDCLSTPQAGLPMWFFDS